MRWGRTAPIGATPPTGRPDGPGPALGRLHADLVDVAPDPVLAGLERLHQRVARRVEVLRGVLVGRGVAAVDLPAGQAQAQVHPGAADLHALAAPRGCLRIDLGDLI